MLILATSLMGSAVLLTGCASESLPTLPSVPPLTKEEGERISEEYLKDRAENLHSLYPGVQLPETERVRFIEQEEYAAVMADCLTQSGFPAKPNDEGGITYDPVPPDSQAEAQSVASYVCEVMYPLNPERLRPFTDEQLRFLYAYSKLQVIPCLEKAGASVPPLPSQQEFIESFGEAGGWDPYANLLSLGERAADVAESCPAAPAELLG